MFQPKSNFRFYLIQYVLGFGALKDKANAGAEGLRAGLDGV